MWRLLFRLTSVIVVSTLISSVIIFAITHLLKERIESALLSENAEMIFLVQNYLNNQLSPDEWQRRLALLTHLSQGRIGIEPLSTVPTSTDEEWRQLQRGEVVVLIEVELFDAYVKMYYRIEGTNKVVAFDGEKSQTDSSLIVMNIIASTLPLLVILLAISAWSYLHWLDLKKLSSATDRIGLGEFSARVSISKYASTYPIASRINDMACYIQRLVSGQRELIHSVSHELRTPIARLSFALDLLKRVRDGTQLAQRIHNMEEDVAELNTLVGELLQLASMGQQYQIVRQPLDLVELIQRCLRVVVYDKQHLSVETVGFSSKVIVQGDQRLIERAMTNLIGNAAKFAQHQIIITIVEHPVQGYQVMIEDDGPGIPESERIRIFEPFYRLENRENTAHHGYGLGLSMVKKIVAVHQGSITVDTSSLGGAKFSVSFI